MTMKDKAKAKWQELTTEKKIVLTSFIFVFMTFAVVAVAFEQTTATSQYGDAKPYDSQLPTEYTQLGDASSDPKKLKTIVKGSIYKTGENMTVFGACFDGSGYLVPEADAKFTAWYPNGTLVVGPNATMDKIYVDSSGTSPNGTGRWKIHVTMEDTLGTYLTEMRCELDGEWSLAFGEWQNPDWVQDIANTYENVSSIYTLLQNVAVNLSQFEQDTNNNFSQVLNQLSTANENTEGLSTSLNEFNSQLKSLNLNRWLIDTKNPFYVLGSGTHNWAAVDMVHPDLVSAVSTDNHFAIWDGESWSEVEVPGVEFRDVSILPTTAQYAWGVGTDSTQPVYSVNGANEIPLNLTGGSPTAANAIKLFQDPDNPSSDFYAYVVGNDGSAYASTDSGASYSLIGSLDAGNVGEISQVVENYDQFGQVNGFMSIWGQGDAVATYDGATWTNYTLTGTVRGVDLLYHDLGYVVVEDANTTKIYKYNGTGFGLEYTIDDPAIVPTGVQIHAQNDIWVTTKDPSTFYHFDGRSWEYSTLAYSTFASVIISLDANGSNATGTGLNDVSMSDSRHGYAVGNDGLILIYQDQVSGQFEDLLTNLTSQLDGIEVNLTPVLDTLDAMNVTLDDVDQNTLLALQNLQEVNLTTQQTLNIVSALSVTVDDLEAMAAGNFTLLNQKLDEINTTVGTIDITTQQNNALINLLNATMTQRFDSVDAVLSDLNNTLYNTNNLITSLNVTTTQGFADMTNLINAMNQTIDGRFNAVDSNLTSIYNAILAINTTFSAEFDALNTTLQNEFSALDTTLTSINATMNERFDLVDGNLSAILTDISYVQSNISALNASMHTEFTEIDNFLTSMNATVDYKLNNILSNTTFTNMYLQTTMFPLLNNTYTGVLDILVQLGIIEGKIDTLTNISTDTQSTVNESAIDIDYLVNQSDRVKAWVTP